ncbi:hypothetical protein AN642_02675 [Epulopiscium sp. SCG-B10WGA-EpuloA2]|nr:hypothetical protein AN642_02675 [Epulopiscium sp. SCG-B10WGA-EpuloA2]
MQDNQQRIIEYFKAKNITVEDLDENYMIVDGKYKINKTNCDWSELTPVNSINDDMTTDLF